VLGYLGNTFVNYCLFSVLYVLSGDMRVIICSAHRNVMELGKLTWKTHTVLRPAVITKGDCKSSVILKNMKFARIWNR
jgi:hypothetical protein